MPSRFNVSGGGRIWVLLSRFCPIRGMGRLLGRAVEQANESNRNENAGEIPCLIYRLRANGDRPSGMFHGICEQAFSTYSTETKKSSQHVPCLPACSARVTRDPESAPKDHNEHKFGTPFFIVDFTRKNWQNTMIAFQTRSSRQHGKQVEANSAKGQACDRHLAGVLRSILCRDDGGLGL